MNTTRIKRVFPIISYHHHYTALKALLLLFVGITVTHSYSPHPIVISSFFTTLTAIITLFFARKTVLPFLLLGALITIQANNNYQKNIIIMPTNVCTLRISYIQPKQYESRDSHIQIVRASTNHWNGTLRATLPSPLEPGESQIVSGTITQFRSENFPWMVNSATYGLNSSIHGILTVDTVTESRIHNSLANTIFNIIEQKRTPLSPESSALMVALIRGDDTELGDGIKYLFKSGGVSHLLAISGFHIALYILILSVMLKPFPIHKSLKVLLLITIPWIIILLTGPTPSTVRALIMSTTFITGTLIRKQSSGLNSLGVAGVIILLFRPLQLFTAGFQLSFVAVFIILITIKVMQMSSLTAKQIKRIVPIAIPLSVGIAITPITIHFFGTVTPLGVITNALYVPFFAILMTISIPLFLILPSSTFITIVLDSITEVAFGALLNIVHYFNVRAMQSPYSVHFVGAVVITLFFILISNRKYSKTVLLYGIITSITWLMTISFVSVLSSSSVVDERLQFTEEQYLHTITIKDVKFRTKTMINWMSQNSLNKDLYISAPAEIMNELLFKINNQCNYQKIFYSSESHTVPIPELKGTLLIPITNNDIFFNRDIPIIH